MHFFRRSLVSGVIAEREHCSGTEHHLNLDGDKSDLGDLWETIAPHKMETNIRQKYTACGGL